MFPWTAPRHNQVFIQLYQVYDCYLLIYSSITVPLIPCICVFFVIHITFNYILQFELLWQLQTLGTEKLNQETFDGRRWSCLPSIWVITNNTPYLAEDCPVLGRRLPRTWQKIAQYLTEDCPVLDRRLPSTWQKITQYLTEDCPVIGRRLPVLSRRLPHTWQKIAPYLTQDCPVLCRRFLRTWQKIVPCLLEDCPKIDSRLPRTWKKYSSVLGRRLLFLGRRLTVLDGR